MKRPSGLYVRLRAPGKLNVGANYLLRLFVILLLLISKVLNTNKDVFASSRSLLGKGHFRLSLLVVLGFPLYPAGLFCFPNLVKYLVF